MKIRYEYQNKKEVARSLNKALGYAVQKNKIKKNHIKKYKSFIQICISNYALCFLDFFVIYILFDFGLENLGTLLTLIFIITFIFNSILLVQYFYSCFKIKGTEGEIRFGEEGIVDTSESGKVVSTSWNKVEMVYIEENIICIFAKRIVYFFPYSTANEKIIKDAIQKYKPSVFSKEQELVEEHKSKSFFWNIGIYIFLSIFIFAFSIGFGWYNESILYDEMEKAILSREVDFQIYSYQKYAIVEKYAKEYYNEYYKLENDYLNYSTRGTFELMMTELAEENNQDFNVIVKNLVIREQKANATLDKMIAMYNKEYALELISNENLDEYYTDLYLDLLFTENDVDYVQNLEEEKEINSEKMKYLKELIHFLLIHSDDWIIEEDELYFYHSENAKEYNELYDIIMKDKETDSGISM